MHIRKLFDELPLAWKLLDFISRNQPALCYCSILLRALMATLISQWSSTSTSDNKVVLQTTVRLLRIMSVGQLLPPPLSSLQEVIQIISPLEVSLRHIPLDRGWRNRVVFAFNRVVVILPDDISYKFLFLFQGGNTSPWLCLELYERQCPIASIFHTWF